MTATGGTVILVDSNVIIDVRSEDPVWFDWSAGALADAADRHQLAINPIIYSEVSVDALRIEDLDVELPEPEYRRLPLPYEAGFSPKRRSRRIAVEAARAARLCPTSTSAPMRQSAASPSSRAILLATAPTSRRSR